MSQYVLLLGIFYPFNSSARVQTLQTYIKTFRRVVTGVMEEEKEEPFASRHEYGNDEWRKQVDAIPLIEWTPTRIQNWKQRFLKENSKTAAAKRKATNTVNSLIRNAKALFSKKLLPFLEKEIDLPSPLPFNEIAMEKPSSPRYPILLNFYKQCGYNLGFTTAYTV